MRQLAKILLTATVCAISFGCCGLFCPILAQQTDYVWPISKPQRYNGESIIVGEYIGLHAGEKKQGVGWKDSITFSTPPVVRYRVIEILKGPPICRDDFVTPINSKISIQYALSDGEAEQPKDWKFDETMLPKIGSRCILFIPEAIRRGKFSAFETFRGNLGRMEASPANIGKVRDNVSHFHDDGWYGWN